MDIATGTWFEYLREKERLDEGLEDIGLSLGIVAAIQEAMPNAPEKAKTWMGTQWKKSKLMAGEGQFDATQLFLRGQIIPYVNKTFAKQGITREIDLEGPHKSRTPLPERTKAEVNFKRTQEAFDTILQTVVGPYKEPYKDPFEVASEQEYLQQNPNERPTYIPRTPFGKWGKKFKGALKSIRKAGVHKSVIERLEQYLIDYHFDPSAPDDYYPAELFEEVFNKFKDGNGNAFDFLNGKTVDPPTEDKDALKKEAASNYQKVGAKTLGEVDGMAFEEFERLRELRERDDPENILTTFEDGTYWYDLKTSQCDQEAERMDHCGLAPEEGSVLVSLRKKVSKERAKELDVEAGDSESFVTLSWDKRRQIIYQIKGKDNVAPDEKWWPKISSFIKNENIKTVREEGGGASPDKQKAFIRMGRYLKKENPDVDVALPMERLVKKAQEKLDEILAIHTPMDYVKFRARARDPHNIAAAEDESVPFITYSAEATLQIPLGWEGYKETPPYQGGRSYIPTEDGTKTKKFKSIPLSDYGFTGDDFKKAAGIADVIEDTRLPGGSNITVSWEIKMLGSRLQGVAEEGEEAGPTAHLMLTFHIKPEGGYPLTVDEFRHFANAVDDVFNSEDVPEIEEKMRIKLAQDGYAQESLWDEERTTLADLKLKNFQTFVKDIAHIEYWFKAPDGQFDVPDPMRISPEVFTYWPFGTVGMSWRLAKDNPNNVARHFGNVLVDEDRKLKFLGVTDTYINDKLAYTLGQQLIELNRGAISSANDPSQTQLAFGDKYKHQEPPPLDLANDIRFIIVPEAAPRDVRVHREGFGLRYRVTVGVDARSSTKEIERVKGFLRFLDENPKLLMTVAEEVINALIVEPLNEEARKTAEFHMDEQDGLMHMLGRQLERKMGKAAEEDNMYAELMIMTKGWIEKNWGRFDPVEKYVAIQKYLKPMYLGGASFDVFNFKVDVFGEPEDIGKPVVNLDLSPAAKNHPEAIAAAKGWEQTVEDERVHRGERNVRIGKFPRGSPLDIEAAKARQGARRTMPGAFAPPVRAESIEEQIERVENLLVEKDPNYDLRIYKMQVACAISRDLGGEAQEVQTEIRGISRVTTVRSLGETVRETEQQTFVTMEIKFELLGPYGRVKYRDGVLIPGLMRIKGLKILRLTPIHRTNIKGSIRTVRESFGGGSVGMAPQNQSALGVMKTPRAGLEDALADWMEGGVKVYDVAVNTLNMRYNVMMPVAELWPYCSREFRAPADAFEGMYQNYIANGPQAPVFVAIGKNGMIKITGNEDIVWFAKRASGAEAEVPVFISYQQQA